MTVGIHLRYQRCESTWIGLQVANWARTEGLDCDVLSLGARAKHVHPDWDNAVGTDSKQDFKSWAKKHSHIVWFNDVTLVHILQAKEQKAKTVILAAWDDPAGHTKIYPCADKVVCFSPSLANRLRSCLQLTNVHYVPLALTTVASIHPLVIRPDRPRILLNLRDSRHQKCGNALKRILANWFHQLPAEWTIWVPRSLLHKKAWIHKCLVSPHAESVFKFESKADWNTQRLLYGWHDLTIWPTVHTRHGLTALLSLAMGSPIATFDAPPVNEYVTSSNGVLAPCQLRYGEDGTACLLPDMPRLEHKVSVLVGTSMGLLKMKEHTADWTEERKNLFANAWREIFS